MYYYMNYMCHLCLHSFRLMLRNLQFLRMDLLCHMDYMDFGLHMGCMDLQHHRDYMGFGLHMD